MRTLIKAISLWEPWASLIACGSKTIETRSFPTIHRGQLLICAAKKQDKVAMMLVEKRLDFQKGLVRIHPDWKPSEYGATFEIITKPEHLNFGKAVALVEVTDCIPTHYVNANMAEYIAKEKVFGNYGLGRFCWFFDRQKIKRIKNPFPVTGKQGFFNVLLPEDIEYEEVEYNGLDK